MPPSRTVKGKSSAAAATPVVAKAAPAATKPAKAPKAPKAVKASTTSTPAPVPSTSTLASSLPASFSRPQATKAVTALLSHAVKAAKERESTELIAREEHVWLNLALKTGSFKKKMMPVRIQLPHPPLPPPPATSVCLLVKDPQREYKDLLEANDIKFVSRVVGVKKLKGKFKPYEARRALMKEHELFLADERVMGLMPELLGSIFYDAKKVPIAVNVKHKNLKNELAQAVASTYMIPSTGTQISIRIATLSTSTPAQTLENLLAAIPPAVAAQKAGWENILSLGIKTSTSVQLPIWSAPLDGRFDLAQKEAAELAAEKEKKGEKRKNVFELYEEEEQEEEKRARAARGEELTEEELEAEKKKAKKSSVKRGKGGKKAAAGGMEVEVEAEMEVPKTPEVVEVPKVAPAKKAEAAVAPSKREAAKDGKKAGKKSSKIGTGGAGKKAKTAVVGKKA